MTTLLIRLAAPLQSWGADSKFTRRLTRREPTKSGVVGLCACAMGIRRDEDDAVARIAALEFGVRIDQLGTLLRDYHVAHENEFWATGKTVPFVSERYYLSDAVFLAGLSGDPELLKAIDEALNAPKLPIYLGRRSCPPSGRLSLGLRETGLVEALRGVPWLASDWYKRRHQVNSLEIIRDAEEGVVTQDLPLSFNPQNRRYGLRVTAREIFAAPPAPTAVSEFVDTSHDPFTALGGDSNVPVTG
jgi:CRISPR system Cascade subunit CasD